jgi:hypothetical protein
MNENTETVELTCLDGTVTNVRKVMPSGVIPVDLYRTDVENTVRLYRNWLNAVGNRNVDSF